MSWKQASSLLALVLAVLLPLASPAQVPGQVDFQGLLLDATGDPVNGLVDLDFALFDQPTGGTSLWSEFHADVSVVDGVYDVALGSITPLTPAVLSGGDVYLEVTVEGETLSPRRRLLAVPYALRAAEAESLDGFSGGYFSEMIEHFDFDGGEPPNTDPREGLGDTDANGVPNFLDPDNDGDGLDDATELGLGSDINLVTPRITGFTPSSAVAAFPATVTVDGSSFQAGMTVAFGSENPTPTNLTPTSFDVALSSLPPETSAVTVTLPNGESAASSYARPASLTISGFSPATAAAGFPATVRVFGTSFQAGMSVEFGAETPTPIVTPPGFFDVDLSPVAPGTSSVSVTLPNGENAISSYERTSGPDITAFSPLSIPADATASVTVIGDGFGPGMTVSFGSEAPTPTNLTTTSFDVVVGPQPAGIVSVVVTLPNAENDSDSFEFRGHRSVFTTAPTAGNIGGLAGADALCATWAGNGGLDPALSFLAWLADATDSPASRFVQSTLEYRRTFDGAKVADDWADLVDGTLDAAIVPAGAGAWANVSLPSALAAGTRCSDWSSSSAGQTGRTGAATSTTTWTDSGTGSCDSPRVLYCFEQ